MLEEKEGSESGWGDDEEEDEEVGVLWSKSSVVLALAVDVSFSRSVGKGDVMVLVVGVVSDLGGGVVEESEGSWADDN